MRVSFARNSAGALEIVDANDYYPFGMNHLKTGNAFFGAGSFKNYKFLGQELQETGFYDMNARFYMADLGRFGMHDPLSASTLDPYGYGYNNPILFADPSGLEGDPVNSGGGPGGPVTPASFGDIPGGYNGAPTLMAGAGANDIAAEQNIQGIVLNSKGKTSGSASAMPTNCIACSVGSGVTLGMDLPKPQPAPLPLNWNCGHCNDHGVVMMDSMWDVVGIVIANNVKPENQYAAAGIGLLAIIMSRGHAADEVLKAELAIEKAEMKVLSRAEMANIKGTGPLRIDPQNLPKIVTSDFTEILAGRGTPRLDELGIQKTVQFNSKWRGALEWEIKDIPGSIGLNNSRIVQHPDGRWGLIINHDYKKIINLPTNSALK